MSGNYHMYYCMHIWKNTIIKSKQIWTDTDAYIAIPVSTVSWSGLIVIISQEQERLSPFRYPRPGVLKLFYATTPFYGGLFIFTLFIEQFQSGNKEYLKIKYTIVGLIYEY